ncbi:hypothetical protein AACH10_04935 [Ideonella sp. DXS22W]|uniref:Uncharacterized protein n=1 Tax=Pseudaquabacterium inlustre TaxID=2984192 RepID=A0ABU9CG89_9BURK
MRFDIRSPSLAQYHWSTLFCRFSPAAALPENFIFRAIAAIAQNAAPWNTEGEFRATVALLHELAHLAQDLSTGIGHWDFLVHASATRSRLDDAASMVRVHGPRPPYEPSAPISALDAEVPATGLDTLLLKYAPFDLIADDQRDRLRRILEHDLGQPLGDDTLFDYSTQAIMESDAAGEVVAYVGGMLVSPEQRAILEGSLDLVDPRRLGKEYWRTRANLYQVLAHHCDLDANATIRLGNLLFGLFADIALAHPPATWVAKRSASLDDFEPLVKFGRLLIAFQRLAGASMDRFLTALMEGSDLEAERLLIEVSPIKYPASDEVYEAWATELREHSEGSMVAKLRFNACEFRLSRGSVMRSRGLGILLEMEAPIIYLTPDQGFVKLDWGARIVDPSQNFGLTQELLDRFTVMELADFLFRTGEFRCPYAEAQICRVAGDRCATGLIHLAQIPNSPQCTVRGLLSHCGVDLPH